MNNRYRIFIVSLCAMLLAATTSAAAKQPTTFKNNVRVTGTLQVDGAQTYTGATALGTPATGTFANTGLKVQDTGGGETTTIKQNSNEVANRIANIPALGADDTFDMVGQAQTLTGVKTFPDGSCINTMGTGSQTYVPMGTLSLQANSFSTAAGTGAQTGHTFTLPANSLVANTRGIRIRAWGHTAANANNKTITINFGAATYSTGAVAANAKDYYLEVTVMRTGTSAQTWVAQGYFNAVPLNFATQATTGTLTQTETGAITVSTSLTDGTSSAGDIVESGFEVDAL